MKSQSGSRDIAWRAYRFKHRVGHGILNMLVTSTFPTSFGRRQLPPRPLVRVALTFGELDALIHSIDRDAAAAQDAGRFAEADRLALRATILRDACQ